MMGFGSIAEGERVKLFLNSLTYSGLPSIVAMRDLSSCRCGRSLRHGVWASPCGGFHGHTASRARDSVVVTCGLSSCGHGSLECEPSSWLRVSCLTTYGDLPGPGTEPVTLWLVANSTTGPPETPPEAFEANSELCSASLGCSPGRAIWGQGCKGDGRGAGAFLPSQYPGPS